MSNSGAADWSRKRARVEEKAEEKGEQKTESPSHPSNNHAPSRGGPPPPGYYGHMYPPPPGGEGYPPPPPPRGYEGYSGYGPPPGYPPPPYMPPPYGMYPPPYPMYPPPHHHHPHHPPPPYYPDPNMSRYGSGDEGAYGRSASRERGEQDDRKPSRTEGESHPPPPMMHHHHPPPPHMMHPTSQEEDDDESAEEGATARLKTYIKPRIPSTQEVLDRRARKNAQSRARAAKLRQRISEIELKPEDDRTEEEVHLYAQYENRRKRKNDRSRERALEKKEEIDRILTKPDKKRTKIEKQFLETALSAKKRKNEGDRLRRQRLKELGLSTKGTGVKPGISARGPLPPQYQPPMGSHPGYGPPPSHHHSGMGDIPMSPLPTMPHHQQPYHPYHPMQSPVFGSPGMMSGLGYPSPQHGRRGAPMTPNRHDHGHMPYMPPPQAYDHPSPSSSSSPSHHPHHLHHPQQQQLRTPIQSRVEQRRNPDGSTSIQIGGRRGSSEGATAASFAEEARMREEQAGMSDLLLENEEAEYGENDPDDDDEKSEE
jgi:hypothetical protein